jgi:hypothetical protein
VSSVKGRLKNIGGGGGRVYPISMVGEIPRTCAPSPLHGALFRHSTPMSNLESHISPLAPCGGI